MFELIGTLAVISLIMNVYAFYRISKLEAVTKSLAVVTLEILVAAGMVAPDGRD